MATDLPSSGDDEFSIIANVFAPLANRDAGRGLIDDAALVDGLVVTTDAIVEGVHFLPNDPLAQVAQKALRVNLSDLAGKGARPLHYLLTLFWPESRPASDIAQLADGLAWDQSTYGISLIGGDTVSTPGPLSLSITMFGRARARTPARADAQIGDDVWVTGTIGDAGLGLSALRGEKFIPEAHAFLAERYRLPNPRNAIGALVARCANGALDVSDGLLGDAGKMAEAANVAIEIDADAIPLSWAGELWVDAQNDPIDARARLAGLGDDYEVLFTAPPGRAGEILAEALPFEVSRIGHVVAGAGARLMHRGVEVAAPGGYAHRLGNAS
jgi:thiamine-monophosphate kinase